MGKARPVLEAAFASLATDTPQVWTDITKYLRDDVRLSMTRGRQEDTQKFNAGIIGALLDNRDNTFNPEVNPNCRPMRQVRYSLEYPWLPGLVPNGGFEQGTIRWTPRGCGMVSISGPDAADPAGRYVRLSLGTSGYGSYSGGYSGAEVGITTDAVPVTNPTAAFAFSVRVRPSTASRTIEFKVEWFDGNHSLGYHSTSVPTSSTVGSQLEVNRWGRIGYSVNSPTGVTAFRLSVSCLDAIAGEVLDVDSVVGDYGSFEGVFPQIVAFADGWLRKWEIGDSTCELNATDGFKVLGNAKLNSTKYVSSALAFLPDVYYRLGETGAAGVVTNFKETVSGDTSAVSVIDTGTGPLCGVAGAIITDNDLAFSSLGQSSADTGHVQIPSGFSVQGNTHDFTVSFWVRSDRSVFTANAWWYGQGTLASPEQFHIGADASGNLVTHLSTGAGADNTIAGLYLFDLLPHMITFSHVHGSPGTTNVYTDGVLRATYSQTTPNLTAQTIRLLTVQGTNVAAEMEIDELMILKTVALGATDILALYNLGRFLYPQELSGARIGRILDLIGWPAGSTYRDVDTGSSEMALVTNAFIQENPLQYLQTVEDSEQGWFFMDRTGRPRWIARGNLYPSPITL